MSCQCLTLKNEPCKKRALKGSKFCSVHQGCKTTAGGTTSSPKPKAARPPDFGDKKPKAKKAKAAKAKKSRPKAAKKAKNQKNTFDEEEHWYWKNYWEEIFRKHDEAKAKAAKSKPKTPPPVVKSFIRPTHELTDDELLQNLKTYNTHINFTTRGKLFKSDCNGILTYYEQFWAYITKSSTPKQIRSLKDLAKFKREMGVMFHPDKNPGKEKWAQSMSAELSIVAIQCQQYLN